MVMERDWEQEAILLCERIGIYEIFSQNKNKLTWYSYFGNEGFYRVEYDLETGMEVRIRMPFTDTPEFLVTKSGTKYNYFCG